MDNGAIVKKLPLYLDYKNQWNRMKGNTRGKKITWIFLKQSLNLNCVWKNYFVLQYEKNYLNIPFNGCSWFEYKKIV